MACDPITSVDTAVPLASTATQTVAPSVTQTPVPTATRPVAPGVTQTPAPTATLVPTPVATATQTVAPGVTQTPAPTATLVPTPAATATQTVAPGVTQTPVPTPTPTPLPSPVAKGVILSIADAVTGMPDAEANAGNQVKLRLVLTNTTDFAGIQLKVQFNRSIVTAVKVTQGTIPQGFLFSSRIDDAQGFVSIIMAGAQSAGVTDIAIADITFDVTGSPGSSTAITLTEVLGSDASAQAIAVTAVSGTIKIRP